MTTSTPRNPVRMAVIGAPHGVRGQLRLKTFTADPEAVGDYGPLFTSDGRTFTILEARPAKDMLVVRLAGINDRETAAALTGTPLFVSREALPDDLEDDEFYHADLIGMEARDSDGNSCGHVVSIHDFGGGDILELKMAEGRTAMIPFTRAAVPDIDMEAGYLRIDPIAAGLVEEEIAPTAEASDEAGSSSAGERRRQTYATGGDR